jgi:hypothetical protein
MSFDRRTEQCASLEQADSGEQAVDREERQLMVVMNDDDVEEHQDGS